jgi:hypothetical protein
VALSFAYLDIHSALRGKLVTIIYSRGGQTVERGQLIIIIIIIIIIMECKNKGDASNNRSNWNHFKIRKKILEQRTGKARYQGTAENSCTGHSAHTAESANVEAQRSLILQTALYAPLPVRAE